MSEEPSLRGCKVRQEQMDAAMRAHLEKKPEAQNEGTWRWKDYGVDLQRTSVVFLGEHVREDKIEISYLVTLQSKCAIPHFGQTGRIKVKDDGSHFTFVQIGNSFGPNDSTQFMSTYVGSEPPTPAHPP
jgi:hypothetical protein